MLTLLLTMCAVEVGLVLLWVVVRYVLSGAALLMLTFLAEAALITVPSLQLGLSVYPADIALSLLFVAAVVRLLRRGGLSSYHVVLLALFLVLAVSFLRGVFVNGVRSSGVETRGVFYLLAAAFYFSTSEKGSAGQHRIQRLWLLSCVMLLALAVLRWAGIQVAGDVSALDDANPMRVLGAGHTLFLATGLLSSLCMNLHNVGAWWERRLFYAIGPALLILQHRTVWVGVLAALLWMFVREPRLRWNLRLFAVGILSAAALVVVLLCNGTFGDVQTRVQASATDLRTLEWRVQGWGQLVERGSGELLAHVLGSPMGGGFERFVRDQVVNVSPHNAYIHVYLRMGIVGLVLFLTMYGVCWRAVVWPSGRPGLFPSGSFYEALLVLQMLFCIPYAVGYPEGAMLGMLAAATAPLPGAARQERRQYACDSPSF